jgi:hypothetical protein
MKSKNKFLLNYLIGLIISLSVAGLIPLIVGWGNNLDQIPLLMFGFGGVIYLCLLPLIFIFNILLKKKLSKKEEILINEIQNSSGKNSMIKINELALKLGFTPNFGKEVIEKFLAQGQIVGKFNPLTWIFTIGADAFKSESEILEGNAINRSKIIGMIKVYGYLDIAQASQMLRIPQNLIQEMLFELVGLNKIKGTISQGKFIVSGDVDDFARELEKQFAVWGAKERSKDGKIENITEFEFED